MGQWQSQTRKMNRHYQSVSKGDEGLIYLDWPYIAQSVYMDPLDDRGLSYLELFTPSYDDGKRFSVTMWYNYFLDPVEPIDFQWEERLSITFYFEESKVKSVKRVTKIVDGVERQATQVTIPMAWIPNVSDELFNATTEEPDIAPLSEAIENIIITYTDIFQVPSEYDEGYFVDKRALFTEYQGSVKNYEYVNNYLNREAMVIFNA